MHCPCDIYDMKRLGFEPWIFHLFILNDEFQVNRLLNKENALDEKPKQFAGDTRHDQSYKSLLFTIICFSNSIIFCYHIIDDNLFDVFISIILWV